MTRILRLSVVVFSTLSAFSPLALTQAAEVDQETLNSRLQAELRADPLLRFEPLYEPQYVKASMASHLAEEDRVFGVIHNGVAKAYPTEYVAWHHIIQDDFGSTPVLVSWCALCGSGAAYINDIAGKPGAFRISGSIGSNVQLGDTESGNAIQQATGIFVEGALKGEKMQRVTAVHASWQEWRAEHPETLLMLPAPGREAAYVHYKPMLATADQRFRGSVHEDSRRPQHDLVVGFDGDGAYMAYPLAELAKAPVVNDTVGTLPLLVTYNRDTQTTRFFSRQVAGRLLEFRQGAEGQFTDIQTESVWSTNGMAISGSLKGQQLETFVPLPSFWFSWAQFYPDTGVFTAPQ